MSDPETEEVDTKPPEPALDEFLINLTGDSLVTGWTATIEAIDPDGVPYLWHLNMPGLSPWHREGMLRASIDRSKRMMICEEDDDGEDF